MSPPTPTESLHSLAHDTGSAWRVRYDPTLGTAAFLEGRSSPLSTTDHLNTAARDFLLRYPGLFGLHGVPEELRHAKTDQDTLGMWHIRYDQLYAGVPIWGASLTVHLGPQRDVQRVHGRTVPLTALPLADKGAAPAPALSPAAAQQAITDLVQTQVPGAAVQITTPALYFIPRGDRLALAFHLEAEAQAPDRPLYLHQSFFVDAQTGAVIAQQDLVAALNAPVPADGSGVGVLGDRRALRVTLRGATYELEDPDRHGLRVSTAVSDQHLPGKIVTSPDPDQWDQDGPAAGLAVDVAAHLATIWDYFASQHGYLGWDGAGHGIEAVVHYGDQQPLAIYTGRALVFGDGDGGDYLAPGAALEVVAHEYAHAVLGHFTGPPLRTESAALHEAIADVWACLVKGGWTIGEAIYRPGGQPTPIRDLGDPHRHGQAATWGEIAPVPADAPADLMRMAGVAGHAGYLLAQRLGAGPAAALYFRAMSLYLHGFSGFSDAADALAAAAQDLHGASAPETAAVAAAWTAVGVPTLEDSGRSAGP